MPYMKVKHAVSCRVYRTFVTIGERIRDCRIELSMTQQQLAEAVCMKKASISGLELGTSKRPAANNLLPIARALKVNADWLITGRGAKRELTPVQQRIAQAMRGMGWEAFDLAEACGGTVAPQSIEAWLDGRSEPAHREIEAIAGPLGKSADWLEKGLGVVQEGHAGRVMYDVRGEPVPENLSQAEIDAIRALRDMDDDRRRRALHDLADAAELCRLKDAREESNGG